MTTIGMVVHPSRPVADGVAQRIALEIEAAGTTVHRVTDLGAIPPELAVVVSVGGDGTFLRAARVASLSSCPVIGVKVGRLGFLTEAEPDEATALVRQVLAGTATIEERSAAVATVELATGERTHRWALNEVIVEKSVRHRLVRLAVEIDREPITTFSGDGVIVATPTGSTAYSFSAGGPIVTPTVDCLLFTPVAAHMVFDRSFVLAPDQQVGLEVLGEDAAIVSTDGQDPMELPPGGRVTVGVAPSPVAMVRRPEAGSFLGRVRDKFELPRGEA